MPLGFGTPLVGLGGAGRGGVCRCQVPFALSPLASLWDQLLGFLAITLAGCRYLKTHVHFLRTPGSRALRPPEPSLGPFHTAFPVGLIPQLPPTTLGLPALLGFEELAVAQTLSHQDKSLMQSFFLKISSHAKNS